MQRGVEGDQVETLGGGPVVDTRCQLCCLNLGRRWGIGELSMMTAINQRLRGSRCCALMLTFVRNRDWLSYVTMCLCDEKLIVNPSKASCNKKSR